MSAEGLQDPLTIQTVLQMSAEGLQDPLTIQTVLQMSAEGLQDPLTIQAVLQMSAGGPYSAPINTSRQRYCRVWMSSVK